MKNCGLCDGWCRVLQAERRLKAAGVRAHADTRSNYNPGWKYAHWEQKGVPLRIEIGPKDLAKNVVTLVRRFDGHKQTCPIDAIGTWQAEPACMCVCKEGGGGGTMLR